LCFFADGFSVDDSSCCGEFTSAEFNNFTKLAAAVPCTFGLAPPDGTAEPHKAIFESMDDTTTGLLAFRNFLKWTVTHTNAMCDLAMVF